MKAALHTGLPQSFALPLPAAPAIMAAVLTERVAEQKSVLDREVNGEAGDREEVEPAEETAKKKRKKKKKNKSAATGERRQVDCRANRLTG